MVLSVPLNQNNNGTNLTMLQYTDNSNFKDEWNILDRVISYVNYYDSTYVGNNNLIQSINVANSFANLAYARYYNVGFYMDGTATQYDTIADSCTTGVNVECSLTICGDPCYRTHHKRAATMIDQIYESPREDDHVYILWTNRALGTYCGNTIYNDHVTFQNTLALVYAYKPIILFLHITDDPAELNAYVSIILTHETAHTLKFDDVYDNDGHEKDGDTACVMERYDNNTAYAFYLDVLSGMKKPFCDSCEQEMKNYTKNSAINGNDEED